jgi:hypothetical protein
VGETGFLPSCFAWKNIEQVLPFFSEPTHQNKGSPEQKEEKREKEGKDGKEYNAFILPPGNGSVVRWQELKKAESSRSNIKTKETSLAATLDKSVAITAESQTVLGSGLLFLI